MGETKIEWAEKSWNPVIGCSKVSPGCANCYAERLANRLRHMEKNKPREKRHYTNVVTPVGWNGNVHLIPDRLDEPLKWKRPSRIFVCSMGDLFHEDVPDSFINDIFTTMQMASHHQYLILTKRPDIMLEKLRLLNYGSPSKPYLDDPLLQVWLGVTAENQEQADKRIPILLQIPAAVRFVSIEPMLGAINLSQNWVDYLEGWTTEQEHDIACDGLECSDDCPNVSQARTHKLDWVILGAESGPKRRYCDPNDMIKVVEQCGSAGVPAFCKQIHLPYPDKISVDNPNPKSNRNLDYYVEKDISKFPPDLKLRQTPEPAG